MRLGLSLLNSKKLTAIQIASVEKAARERQLHFIDVLISTQTISAQELAQHLSLQCQQPLVDLAKVSPNAAGVDAVIIEALGSLDIAVLGEEGGVLMLGQSDPTRDDVAREAERMVQRPVTWRVVEHDKLRSHLDGGHDTAMYAPEGLPPITYEDSGSNNAIPSGADVEDAPVVRYLQKVLNEALLRGASDLHFEPFETFYRVRFRIDGALQEVSRPPISVRETLSSRIKVLSRLDISEKRVPQDGRMKLQMQRRDEKTGEPYSDAIDFRVSTLPTLYGEKVVIRILESSTDKLDIDRLGYSDAQKNLILETIKRPYGMVLVTGPTGSGKTVSLYTFLNLLNKDDINIATAEDPVEIQLAGVNQVTMNDKAGLNFATALKAFLRQDPDIIMVGEIRDLETADIALKAAQTGHMVFSTLHTNDAPTTLTRLVNMGVAPFNVAASVLLITAQRLARRLCTECSRPASLSREALLEAGFKEAHLDGSWRPRHAVGCPNCNGTGYRGRVGIYQVMPITEAIQEIILRQGTATDIAEQARKDGVVSLRESGLEKVREGLTTIEEVIATTNE